MEQNTQNNDIKIVMGTFNQNLFKLKVELDSLNKAYNQNKDLVKAENLKANKDLESIRKDIIDIEECLARQSTYSNLLEKELALYKSTSKSSLYLMKNRASNYSTSDEYVDMLLSMKLFEQKIRSGDKKELKKAFNMFKSEINESMNIISSEFKIQCAENKSVNERNNDLKLRFYELDEKNYKKKFCIHCHLEFIPKFNDDKSCLYHPGKLQYYSCRGCGDDEYYTCCSNCVKCSKGCKYSKHVTEIG